MTLHQRRVNQESRIVNKTKSRHAFIGQSGPADWLPLKQEVLDPAAFQREQILPLVRELAKYRPNMEILDCGSGEGQFTELLHGATNSSRIIGLDNYRRYLRKAQSNFPDVPIVYLQANIYKMPFADATFDIVASQSTFDVLNGKLMFKEMIRVLKPGGWIYLSMLYDSTYPYSPEPDRDLEAKILRNFDLYAVEWGESYGIKEGDSRAGRRLLHYAQSYGLNLLKLAISDWFLYPNPEYTSKEKAVMHLMLDIYFQASKRAPPEHAIDPVTLEKWKQKVQSDIDNSRTTFTHHQYSMLAEKPISAG